MSAKTFRPSKCSLAGNVRASGGRDVGVRGRLHASISESLLVNYPPRDLSFPETI